MAFTNKMVLPLTSAYVRTTPSKKTTKSTNPDVSCYDREKEEIINIPFQNIVETATETTTPVEITYSESTPIGDNEIAVVNASTGKIDIVEDAQLATSIKNKLTTQKPVVKTQVKKTTSSKKSNQKKTTTNKKK